MPITWHIMRRFPLFLPVLALVAAACNASPVDDPSSNTAAPPAPTTTEAPEAMLLSYQLEAGTVFTYEVELDQAIDITTNGDASALDEEGIPGEMSIRVTGTSNFTHSVADGTDPGTFAVTITGDFAALEFSGTVDGEPVDQSEIPDLAAIEPVDITVIVDEQGNVISGGGGELEDLFGMGGMGGFGGLEDFSQSMQPGRFVGPPLSDGEVAVGDTWSETIEIPMMGEGAEPATTDIESTVARTDTLDGVEVMVIDTTISTSAIEIDLAEILIGMLEAFLPEDATDEERAELAAISEDLRFGFSLAPSVATMTTWFDPSAGLARTSEFAGDNHFEMSINAPDEASGEMIAFGMVMEISQKVGYRLVDSGNA
jgi:hypothetical protein